MIWHENFKATMTTVSVAILNWVTIRTICKRWNVSAEGSSMFWPSITLMSTLWLMPSFIYDKKSLFPEVLHVIELKWDESVICTAAIQIHLDKKECTAMSQRVLYSHSWYKPLWTEVFDAVIAVIFEQIQTGKQFY